ncbi:MAG: cyclase family protein [bacterium]
MCSPRIVTTSLPDVTVSRRDAIAAAGAALASIIATRALSAQSAPRRHIAATHLVDLTHPLSPSFPYIPIKGLTHGFRSKPVATIAKNGVYALEWQLIEHIGTHIDAPSHFNASQPNLELLPIENFIVPIAVLDLRAAAQRNHDYAVVPDDVRAWERRHGRLPENAMVVMRSGWDAFVGSSSQFLGTDSSGTMHFPGFAAETCEFLLRERHVSGVGVDTISFDIGPDSNFAAHKALFAGGKWAIENIAHLDRIPPSGATALIGAIPVVSASGSPIRLLAAFD